MKNRLSLILKTASKRLHGFSEKWLTTDKEGLRMSFAFWFLWIAHITNTGKLAAMMKLAQTQGEATRKYALINRLKIEWNDIYCDDLSTSRTNMGKRLFLSVFTFYLFFFPSLVSWILSFLENNLCISEKKMYIFQ